MNRQQPPNEFHVLILSRRCPHSKAAYELLQEKGLLDMPLLKIVWVEDNVVKLPSYVQCVPFLRTNTGHRMVDRDLFMFLDTILPMQASGSHGGNNQKTSHQQVPNDNNNNNNNNHDNHNNPRQPAYDDDGPAAMFGADNGFSDSFSFLDSTSQRFTHQANIEDDFPTITTPKDDSSSRARRMDNSAVERLIEQRNMEIQNIVPQRQA